MSQKSRKPTPVPLFRTDYELEILRVLWAHRDRPLVRSQVFRQMNRETRPSVVRVGQLLSAFHAHGFTECEKARFQGRSEASFYQLSPKGLDKCLDLRIGSNEETFFQVSDEERRSLLTPDRLSRRGLASRRMIGFYAYRGGLGRTTAVAHVAHGLARRAKGRKVLVVDFDFESSDLDRFFFPRGTYRHDNKSGGSTPQEKNEPSQVRGLRGLLVDYAREKTWKRASSLSESISDGACFFQPFEDESNLFFLSSGMSTGDASLATAERSAAMDLLRREAIDSRGSLDAASFLSAFKKSLLTKFDLVLLDSGSGRSLGAGLMTTMVDQLALCLNPSDVSLSALGSVQAVLGAFLKWRATGSRGSVFFAFAFAEDSEGINLVDWIERHLVLEVGSGKEPSSLGFYDVESIPRDNRLRYTLDWRRSTPFYDPITKRLDGLDSTFIPPEARALVTLLDPRADPGYQSICAGSLEGIPLGQLVGSINWYLNDAALHRGIDSVGLRLLGNVLEAHTSRLLSKLKELGLKEMD